MKNTILSLVLFGVVPVLAKSSSFDDFMATLDLNAPGYELRYKDGGTSVGIKVSKDGNKSGKWVPSNSATDVESQVVSFQLAKWMEMPGLVVPSDYYVLSGAALESFRQMLQSANEKNKWRVINRDDTLRAIARQPQGLLGVFTDNIKCYEVEGLANESANTLNSAHPIAQYIRAEGPMPTEAPMTLKGLPSIKGQVAVGSALDLAQEFSRIMVLDILTGQWDRWSGGNIEATIDSETGRAHFIARDNGGASMRGRGTVAKYFGLVTRFDRFQIESVERLGQSLRADPEGTARLLKLKSDPQALRERIEKLLQHVEDQIRRYGPEKVYFRLPEGLRSAS